MLYAKDHFACAGAIFKMGSPLWLDSAGHLAHLGIELALKALLLEERAEFPGTHDLRQLHKHARRLGLSLSEASVKALREINKLGSIRYPNPHAPVKIATEDWPAFDSLFHEIVAHRPDLADDKHRRTPEGYIGKGDRVLMYKPIEPEE